MLSSVDGEGVHWSAGAASLLRVKRGKCKPNSPAVEVVGLASKEATRKATRKKERKRLSIAGCCSLAPEG